MDFSAVAHERWSPQLGCDSIPVRRPWGAIAYRLEGRGVR